MRTAKIWFLFFITGMLLAAGGCRYGKASGSPEKAKIHRFFNWAAPRNEKEAEKYVHIGVTDVLVSNKRQFELAKRYGLTPYWKIFSPAGPHPQVMSPAEEKHYAYINGHDLGKKISRSERRKILHKRRLEKQHRYGGEMVSEIDTLNDSVIPCFISDEGLALSRKKIDQLLKDAPKDAAGMYVDYIGYTNHNGCYCRKCLGKLGRFLAERKLKDSAENRTLFYREKLVEYYNGIIGHIKSRRPDFRIVVHIYPDFKNDPLYGNRIQADFCAQTVAWYFKWDAKKIRKYTKTTVEQAKKYHSFAEG